MNKTLINTKWFVVRLVANEGGAFRRSMGWWGSKKGFVWRINRKQLLLAYQPLEGGAA